MWSRLRKWKHTLAPLLLGVAYFLLSHAPEKSLLWFVGLVSAVALALAYVIEEVVRNIQGAGHPCAACGHRIRMRSFRIRNRCPGCGQQL